MPFTAAHPAAALPLRARLGHFGSAAALAIGAMAPDLAYFLPLGISGSQTHSLPGVVCFGVPATVLGVWVFHALVRPLAIGLAPVGIRRRADPAWTRLSGVGAPLPALAVSGTVGALTHVAWDAFTHASGFAVRAIPALSTPLPVAGDYRPAVYTLLQHLSSAVGLLALARWARRWLAERAPGPDPLPDLGGPARIAWAAAILAPPGAVALLCGWQGGTGHADPVEAVRGAISRGVFCGGTALLATLLLGALVWRRAHPGR